jgi:hypothetical protein
MAWNPLILLPGTLEGICCALIRYVSCYSCSSVLALTLAAIDCIQYSHEGAGCAQEYTAIDRYP